ncbi:unnamed protein product [Prorocentrum cordatum]|uniref:Uncharacterized protein n=1 Tax=Prorocentrum cordatum TaxID=2364126 RepID=A0ABN9VQG9_9DINO|nr:unnamed protein product [Polarella glacialis]
MNRARMKALKAFLSRPWVKQKLHEALKEFNHASYKRLCDAVADVSLQSNKRCDELHEKIRKLRGQLSKETQKAQDQGEQVKQLQKENQRLAKENKQQGELLEKQQAELDKAQAALKASQESPVMANVQAMGMTSLGKAMERPNHTEDVLHRTFAVANAKKLAVALAESMMVGPIDRPGSSTVWDLPIKHWEGRTQKTTSYVVDVVSSPGDLSAVDWGPVKEMMSKGDYNSLPPPLGFPTKTEIPMFLNLHVSKPAGEDYIVVKFISFLNRGKFSVIQQQLIDGEPYVPDWTRDRHTTLKTMHLLFDNMGGILFKYWEFAAPVAAPAAVAPGDEDGVEVKKRKLRVGFDFIMAEAPRGYFDCEQMLWVEHQLVDPDSPVHHFRRELIDRVLEKIQDRDHFAVKETYYPCLLHDIRPEYLDIAKRIIKTLLTNTLLTIGEAKFGKTPLMYILAMAIARWHADMEKARGNEVAAVRVSAEMDFFRGEVGEKWAPCIFDDGGLSDQRPRVLKVRAGKKLVVAALLDAGVIPRASCVVRDTSIDRGACTASSPLPPQAFFDPTQMQAMTYVRWGAPKFVRGQARFGGENEYNASAEPSLEDWVFAVTSSDNAKKTTQFLIDMILPAFPKHFSSSQIGAMLKRCNTLLNTKTALYFRPAGQGSAVEKYPLYEGHLKPDAGRVLWAHLQDSSVRRDAEEFGRLPSFEKKDMAELMAKHMKSARAAAAALEYAAEKGDADAEAAAGAPAVPSPPDDFDEHGFFGGAPEAAPVVPRTPEAAPTTRIKLEPGVWKNLKIQPSACIDLSTPSPKKRDMTLERQLEQILDEEGQRGAASSAGSGAQAA